ncbi:hypothetical protein EIK77_000748 [Talaromyces pinophilus]|nr:hypothetical protein EIK77_000748 [Talaromyces pinophilus]
MARFSVIVAAIGSQLLGLTSAIPYSEYILAPSDRTLSPVSVYKINGTVDNAIALTISGTGGATFAANSNITYDYGKNIGGIASFVVSNVNASATGEFIGVGFSESSLWISSYGSDATNNAGIDEIIWFSITGPGNYSLDLAHNRGGFRYLNLYHNSSGTVSLNSLTTFFNAAPSLQNYTGYFHADDDDKLNRVWYASAYTDQLCTIPSDQGNSLSDLSASDPNGTTYWFSNSTLTNGSSALVDGAKRDKLIWPGDFGISVPAVFLSTNEVDTIKVSLQQLFAEQNAETGAMPYAASPIIEDPPNSVVSGITSVFSFTYHLHGLLGLYYYYKYTGDADFVAEQWDRFKFAMNYSLSYVDESGLAYIPVNNADWLRNDMGYHNIEANAILVYTLKTGLTLADVVADNSVTANWTSTITGVETAANQLLWDPTQGLYKDNENATIYPQDGNAWAIISGIANTTTAVTISNSLQSRWGTYGAPAPEAGDTISPFISGYELQAHFLAGQPQNAIDLIRFMWADFMLDDPRMTNSTFIEGYDVSGALHYPAYSDDARVSHAHGWSTGPLLALSSYVAGLQVLNSTNWIAYPRPGNLSAFEAGFELNYGSFASSLKVHGDSTSYSLSTPAGTSGSIILDIPTYNANVTVTGTANGFFWTQQVDAWTFGASPRGISFWGPQDSTSGTVEVDEVPGGDYSVIIRRCE